MAGLFRSRPDPALADGLGLMARGEYHEAANLFGRAVARTPREISAYLGLAEAAEKMGERAECRTVLHQAVDMVDADGRRRIIDFTGPRRLVPDAWYNAAFAFSPDGGQMAVCSARRDTNADNHVNALDRCGLYLINTATGEEHQLLDDQWHTAYPVYSPDGRHLLYTSARRDTNGDGRLDYRDNAGLYLLDLDTGDETCLATDSAQNKYPCFSPDGRRIAWCSWRDVNDRAGIWLMDLESRSERLVVTDRFDQTYPSFTPDGKRLVYSSWRNDTNHDGRIDFHDNTCILMAEIDSRRETLLVPDRYNNLFPSLSPDGRHLLYLSRRRDTNHDGHIDSLDNPAIFLLDLASRRETVFVPDDRYSTFPSFSPDGRHVLFLSSEPDARAGHEADREDPGESAVQPMDGYHSRKGIYLIGIGDREPVQLVSDRFLGCRAPRFSPDGRTIGFQGWRPGTRRGIYLYRTTAPYTAEELHALIDANL